MPRKMEYDARELLEAVLDEIGALARDCVSTQSSLPGKATPKEILCNLESIRELEESAQPLVRLLDHDLSIADRFLYGPTLLMAMRRASVVGHNILGKSCDWDRYCTPHLSRDRSFQKGAAPH